MRTATVTTEPLPALTFSDEAIDTFTRIVSEMSASALIRPNDTGYVARVYLRNKTAFDAYLLGIDDDKLTLQPLDRDSEPVGDARLEALDNIRRIHIY